MSSPWPGPPAELPDSCSARLVRAAGVTPTVFRPDVPVSPLVIVSIFPFFADDRSDLTRPAVLPDIFLADVDRDPLECVPLLFELRFLTAALPDFERPVFAADAGPLSFFGPDSSHNPDSVALLILTWLPARGLRVRS